MVWYKELWDRETKTIQKMLQNDWAELVCDFEFNLRKMKTVKATDLLENKE